MQTTSKALRRLALGAAAAAALVPAAGATTASADAVTLGPQTVLEGATASYPVSLRCTAAEAGPSGECAYLFKTRMNTAKVDNSGPATKDYNAFAVLGRAVPVGGTWSPRYEVKTLKDKVCEGKETFFVDLTINGNPAATGTVTIKENCVRTLGRAPKPCTNTDTLVTQLTAAQAEAAVLCLTNQKRRQHSAPALTLNARLADSARSHADKSVRLRWWSTTDGMVSHDDPEIANPADTPRHDIGVRIAAGGYCPGAPSAGRENTFGWTSSSPRVDPAAKVFAPTARGAVEWWYQSPDHRRTMLDPSLRELGVGVARGSAFPQETGGVPSGTFVQHYGRCG
ncbi:MAG TPA: CAP domain-containing protein [Baekduia sp.]|nr:CAP domain-containing protein [Baekduia sp.]